MKMSNRDSCWKKSMMLLPDARRPAIIVTMTVTMNKATTKDTSAVEESLETNNPLRDESTEQSHFSLLRSKLKSQVAMLDTLIARHNLNSHHDAPPVGLEASYRNLYSLLQPCLSTKNQNVAALVMGKRGTGKTLLVERTLHALAKECKFRVVRLHGLVIKGDDVGHVVQEIVRQLSDLAMAERHDDLSSNRHLLRLRTSSFMSNLALLDENLRMASVDQIPIVIVLDEFDALLGSSPNYVENDATDRQLLLYHLLDRVTSAGTWLSLIAITSHLAAVSMLEKRVKSRAEGTSQVIFVNPHSTYESLVDILLSKFECGSVDLRKATSNILRPTQAVADEKEDLISEALQRNYNLGKDLRWFSRVVSCALSLYREDCLSILRNVSSEPSLPTLSPEHFLQALTVMNASFGKDIIIGNMAADSRMQALLDMSGPQVALVLAARRILARDAFTEDISVKPLTLERMLQEYQTYRGPHRYSNKLLQTCLVQLLETDVFRPSSDHTGGGPLQYRYQHHFENVGTLTRMPLHLVVDIERELGEALKNDLLDCSTSLREWGRKKN